MSCKLSRFIIPNTFFTSWPLPFYQGRRHCRDPAPTAYVWIDNITATTRVMLYFSAILEWLGMLLLATCFPQLVESYHTRKRHSSQPLSKLIHLASKLPTVMILTGIVVLAAVLVVETLKTSLAQRSWWFGSGLCWGGDRHPNAICSRCLRWRTC